MTLKNGVELLSIKQWEKTAYDKKTLRKGGRLEFQPPEMPRRKSILNENVEAVETAVETAEAAVPAEAPRARTRRRLESPRIKSLNGTLSTETADRIEQKAMTEVQASITAGRILRGTVAGIENYKGRPCAIVKFNGLKVLIPASEFFITMPNDDTNPDSPTYMSRTYNYMAHRLGSEVEFICVGVGEEDNKLVAASRTRAMKIRQKQMYTYTNDKGEYLLQEGQVVEARVASALSTGILVEVGGLDIFVKREDVSWMRKTDVSNEYEAGDTVLVKVMKINREDENNISAEVSIKEATQHPFDRVKDSLSTDPRSRYFGTITHITTKAIYVRLHGEDVEVVCKLVRDGSIPSIGTKVAIRINEIIEARKLIRGEIVWQGRA